MVIGRGIPKIHSDPGTPHVALNPVGRGAPHLQEPEPDTEQRWGQVGAHPQEEPVSAGRPSHPASGTASGRGPYPDHRVFRELAL